MWSGPCYNGCGYMQRDCKCPAIADTITPKPNEKSSLIPYLIPATEIYKTKTLPNHRTVGEATEVIIIIARQLRDADLNG